MTEPLETKEHAGEFHRPVPDEAPMPTKAGRNVGLGAIAALALLGVLLCVALTSAGWLRGWWLLLYLIPGAVLAATSFAFAREALVSGRR